MKRAEPIASPTAFDTAVIRIPNPMVAIVWLAIFVPGHLFGWWVERGFAGLVLMTAVMIMLIKAAPWETRHSARQAGLLFFFVQFFYVTSFIFSVAFHGITTGSRDYFDLLRFLILWAFSVYVIRHFDEQVERAIGLAAAASMYFSLFVLACYVYPVALLSSFFADWLYLDTKTYTGFGAMRLSVPFENPNFLGFFTVQALAYFFFFSRSPTRFLHAAAALVVLYFTGSRTAWAASFLVIAAAAAVYTYLGLMQARVKFAVHLSLGVLIVVIGGANVWQRVIESPRVRRVVDAAQTGGIQNETNAAKRIEQFHEIFGYIGQSPVFGWGPSKYETMGYVDNQYLLWMLRNGAIGTTLILAGLFLALYRLGQSVRGDPLRSAGAAAFVAAVALMLVAGAFLDNFRLFFLTVFFLSAMMRGRRA